MRCLGDPLTAGGPGEAGGPVRLSGWDGSQEMQAPERCEDGAASSRAAAPAAIPPAQEERFCDSVLFNYHPVILRR